MKKACVNLSVKPTRGLVNFLATSIALSCLPLTGSAATVVYDIDPVRSHIQLAGTVSGSAFQEQAAGSLSNAFTGTLIVELTETEIRFPGGSKASVPETQPYAPAPGGANGSAPAAFGAKATVKVAVGPITLNATAAAAARTVSFDLESLNLTRTPIGFDARGVSFRIPESAGTKLDYRTSGTLTLSGSEPVLGLALNRASNGTLALVDGVETLTIPVDASYLFEILSPNDTEMKFVGEIVAKRRASTEPQPAITFQPPASPGVPLTLSWPDTYKLQRATTLTPPNWQDSPATSPLQVPLALPGEYFRVIPK